MEKEMLFRFMQVKLRDAGFTPEEIKLHIAGMAERYRDKTDAEAEADVMHRGGPSQMVARIIEQRNTVLMQDPEYRAFVEGIIKDDATDTVSKDSPRTDSAPIQSNVSTDEETKQKTETLADWFSAEETKAEEDVLPPMFRGTQNKGKGKDKDDDDVKIAGATHPAAAIHTVQPEKEPPIPQPQTQRTSAPPPVPGHTQKPRPPIQDANGSTKIMDLPTEEGLAIRQRQTENPWRPEPVQDHFHAKKPSADKGSSATVQNLRPHRANTTDLSLTGKRPAKKQKPAFLRLPEITYWGEGSAEGVRNFRIIFWCSLPFVILLLAALAAVVLALTIGMAALAAVLVAALVVWVALGSVIALIGLIYGISQLFLVLPIGMFELGLGIAAVGITMLIGIVIYNLAVRFLPFALRQLYRFVGFFRHYIVDLYYYVKGECYRR